MLGERSDFGRLRAALPGIQEGLREAGLDGWLLYDLHARNTVAARLLGVGDLTRRYFVLLPASGEPLAVLHEIERGPWEAWPWQRRGYAAWTRLHEVLADALDGRRVAMEYSERDAVPAVDTVPSGVVEMVRSAGAQVVSSKDLITRFYARWTEDDLASHRRAARVVAGVAADAFRRLAARVREGGALPEGELRAWVVDALAEGGAGVDADAIVANTVNAANPHYSPGARGAELRAGELVLLDLWGRESEAGVFADQTWMAYLGPRVPERVLPLWEAVRDARDAVVDFLHARDPVTEPAAGFEADDVSRGLIRERGFAEHFVHRTGHSIDRDLHGMGPNIDNLETHETRLLIPGVGFSVEPGIYVPGDAGLRSEINVYMTPGGPEVTTPDPQAVITTLLDD